MFVYIDDQILTSLESLDLILKLEPNNEYSVSFGANLREQV